MIDWIIHEAPKDKVKELSEYLNTSALLASILINRSIDRDIAYKILNDPESLLIDPKRLINVEKAADEIIEAVNLGAEIWIFADYDGDGLTSGFTMTDFLRQTTDNDVFVYYPDRSEGYGLSMKFCKEVLERKEEGKEILVITVDNGTSCIEEVKFLKENGIRIVVTDHHKGKAILPDCTIVNPHIDDDPVFHHLCGCTVAHKTVMVIQDRVGMNKDYAEKYYFASAIGTVADIMPMVPENMAITRIGLNKLNGKQCPPVWKVFKDFIGKPKINARDIAWDVSPRLNATGRMGSIDTGATLFFSENEPTENIKSIVLEIEELNEARKALTKKAAAKASSTDFSKDSICIFDGSEYPNGILGIIAGKISEENNKPAMVMGGEDTLSGSARAPYGYKLQNLFKKEVEKGNLLSYGGHEQAAGFALNRDKIESLRASLNESTAAQVEELDDIDVGEQVLTIDGIITLADLNKRNYDNINELPYDRDLLPAPLFMLKRVRVVDWSLSKNNKSNIKFTIEDELGKQSTIWAWKFGETYKEMGEPEFIDMAGRIEKDFMSNRKYTMGVEGIRPSA